MRIFLAGEPLHHDSRPHWLIIFTLVESCTLYTLNVVAALVTFLCNSFAQYAAVDSIVPIVVSVWYILFLAVEHRLTRLLQGICFSLIVLQIRFHVSASHGPQFASDGHTSAVVWHRPHPRAFCGGAPEEPKNPTGPIQMAIHVSKHTDTDLNRQDDAHSSLEIDKPEKSAPS